ncbi:TetR/AcrR family transcriptional regulator [Mycobacteroides abscessus]|nr:TetR/AcrR family transcriptional regulator [Mycobacteroides abscessus]MDM2427139.1 TetR/AcrR family transcriptional regulator [Mycobacteroides abscessus]MDM2432194.1 TetR/AcrR family transcriptional regulator [Mycobacteroides abscessus]MDM2436711.1 TetR/AcrR family transcriptional regulator [Mycobacteroides abscessus]MDM2438679.1 TetR/AcrR family transcriptional regulator [Mycobacteroides abscessus]
MDRSEARTKLLDAAAQVLLEGGLERLSVRRVTSVAGMNVNAVNYSFGSKETLLQQLMLQVVEPGLIERSRRIDAVASTPGHTVEDLVRAFLSPLLEADPRLFALFVEIGFKPRLHGDMRFEPTREAGVQAGIDQLATALSPLLPAIPLGIITFRVELALGTAFGYKLFAADLANKYAVDAEVGRQCLTDDLFNFVCQALAAPAPSHVAPDGTPSFVT